MCSRFVQFFQLYYTVVLLNTGNVLFLLRNKVCKLMRFQQSQVPSWYSMGVFYLWSAGELAINPHLFVRDRRSAEQADGADDREVPVSNAEWDGGGQRLHHFIFCSPGLESIICLSGSANSDWWLLPFKSAGQAGLPLIAAHLQFTFPSHQVMLVLRGAWSLGKQ